MRNACHLPHAGLCCCGEPLALSHQAFLLGVRDLSQVWWVRDLLQSEGVLKGTHEFFWSFMACRLKFMSVQTWN